MVIIPARTVGVCLRGRLKRTSDGVDNIVMIRTRRDILADIASRIVSLIRAHPIRVAIDGVDAAGKTTLANDPAPVITALGRPIIRASIDGFHNPQENTASPRFAVA